MVRQEGEATEQYLEQSRGPAVGGERLERDRRVAPSLGNRGPGGGPGQEKGDSAGRAGEGPAGGAGQVCWGSGAAVTGGARGNGPGQGTAEGRLGPSLTCCTPRKS